jgi:hypothetical protein
MKGVELSLAAVSHNRGLLVSHFSGCISTNGINKLGVYEYRIDRNAEHMSFVMIAMREFGKAKAASLVHFRELLDLAGTIMVSVGA